MAETSTTAEVSSPPVVVEKFSSTDTSALLRMAELQDQLNDNYDDDDEIGAQKDSKETSDTRATDESGDVEAKAEDKAEPSAEEPVIDSLGRKHDPKTGRLLPKEQQEPEQLETEAEKPVKSKYADAKAREAETWKKIDAEKTAVRQEAARLQAENQRIAQQKAEIARLTAIPRRQDGSPHEFNSRQYAKAADDFYARGKAALAAGDPDEANRNFAQAEACSQSADQVAQFEQQVGQRNAFDQYWNTWQQNMDYTIQQDPSLTDPENPVVKDITALLDDPQWGPVLERIPNGFGLAAQVMKWKHSAEEASALSQKNKELEAEVTRLTKATSVRAAPSSGMPKARTGSELTQQEADARLREMVAMADAA